jgi:uncharacterized protein
MATPSLTKHTLPGSLGELLVDVRTGDRRTPRPAVVIMHGFKGFKDWGMFPPLAERVARAGLTAVSFNVSGSGVDDRGEFTRQSSFGRNTYSAELEDLGRVMAALKEGKDLDLPAPSSIGLFGHSRGGGMAILETARNPAVQALATWAAIGSVDRWTSDAKAAWRRRGFVNIQNTRTGQVMPLLADILEDLDRHGSNSLNIPRAAEEIRVPWLIVHGQNDETVEVADAGSLHDASQRRAHLLIIPGAGHTFGATHPLSDMTPALDQAMEETGKWFVRNLR